MTKPTLDMIEVVVNKITEKFLEAMSNMTKEITQCISKSFGAQILTLESRLVAIEGKLATFNVASSPDPASTSAASVAEVVSKTIIELEKQREETETRALNVIVSGLTIEPGTPDKVYFEKFCEDHLTVKPHVVRIRRLGRSATNRPPKLCVTLRDRDAVSTILDSATLLRHSHDFSGVFFNRDLTKAQALAAYEARCKKRAQTTNPSAGGGGSQPFST